MKNIILIIGILLFFVNCNRSNKTSQNLNSTYPKYYLNVDSIEIIEVNKNNALRYILKDSLEIELKPNSISYFPDTLDSLQLLNNPKVYKRIELNTKEEINFDKNSFWTGFFKDSTQYWIHFFEVQHPDNYNRKTSYKAYSGYTNIFASSDTVFNRGYKDFYSFKLFNKFRFAEIGPSIPTLCLLSKCSEDSISIIPVESYLGKNKMRLYFLEKYNSFETTTHLGEWELKRGGFCKFSEDFIGNKLKIKSDSIIFYDNTTQLLKLNYLLGLDSKYLELHSNTRQEKYFVNISTIKVLEITNYQLKLKLEYDGRLCKESDTLIYQKQFIEK